jgi:hypothetical protein
LIGGCAGLVLHRLAERLYRLLVTVQPVQDPAELGEAGGIAQVIRHGLAKGLDRLVAAVQSQQDPGQVGVVGGGVRLEPYRLAQGALRLFQLALFEQSPAEPRLLRRVVLVRHCGLFRRGYAIIHISPRPAPP